MAGPLRPNPQPPLEPNGRWNVGKKRHSDLCTEQLISLRTLLELRYIVHFVELKSL